MTKNTRLYFIGLVIIASISATTIVGVGMLTSPKQQPAPGPDPVPPCKEKVIYAADNGTTIHLNKGDILHLSLKSYGDGGYSWVIISQDKAKLSLISTSHVNGTDAPGDFGSDVWTFKAIESGSSTLSLVCQRPWATTDVCACFTVQVVVQ